MLRQEIARLGIQCPITLVSLLGMFHAVCVFTCVRRFMCRYKILQPRVPIDYYSMSRSAARGTGKAMTTGKALERRKRGWGCGEEEGEHRNSVAVVRSMRCSSLLVIRCMCSCSSCCSFMRCSSLLVIRCICSCLSYCSCSSYLLQLFVVRASVAVVHSMCCISWLAIRCTH